MSKTTGAWMLFLTFLAVQVLAVPAKPTQPAPRESRAAKLPKVLPKKAVSSSAGLKVAQNSSSQGRLEERIGVVEESLSRFESRLQNLEMRDFARSREVLAHETSGAEPVFEVQENIEQENIEVEPNKPAVPLSAAPPPPPPQMSAAEPFPAGEATVNAATVPNGPSENDAATEADLDPKIDSGANLATGSSQKTIPLTAEPSQNSTRVELEAGVAPDNASLKPRPIPAPTVSEPVSKPVTESAVAPPTTALPPTPMPAPLPTREPQQNLPTRLPESSPVQLKSEEELLPVHDPRGPSMTQHMVSAAGGSKGGKVTRAPSSFNGRHREAFGNGWIFEAKGMTLRCQASCPELAGLPAFAPLNVDATKGLVGFSARGGVARTCAVSNCQRIPN